DRIAKYAPPRKIGERRGLGRPQQPPELLGRHHRRPLVVWPHAMQKLVAERCAAGQQSDPHDESSKAPARHQFPPAVGTVVGAGARGGGSAFGGGAISKGVPFTRWDSRSTSTKRAGTRKMANPVEKIMPTMVTVPIRRRASAPAPVAIHSGSRPKIKANDV